MARKLWNKLGWLLFWFSLPALFVYMRRSERTRILISSGEKVLVVKGWMGDGRWLLPGGGLHSGEDPKEGVLRELLEETGVKLDSKKITEKGKRFQDSDLVHFPYYLFAAEAKDQALPTHRTAEITQVAWVNKKDLAIGNAQQHVIDAVNKVQ